MTADHVRQSACDAAMANDPAALEALVAEIGRLDFADAVVMARDLTGRRVRGKAAVRECQDHARGFFDLCLGGPG